jgi:hypothetical protein
MKRPADTVAFERAAAARKVRIKRGLYGELLGVRARFAWWFFYAGWRGRQVYDTNRRAARGKR